MAFIRKYGHWIISIYIAVIFLDSLRFKFTNAHETQVIFGKLDAWANSFGAGGLFSQTGLFSQYVIGSAELIASALILFGLFTGRKTLHGLGGLIGVAVMTGAISFHLFTPLGIDPNNDGGGLFYAAIGVWLGSIAIAFLRRKQLLAFGCQIVRSLSEK
ncbi:hypothetical protein [Hirschia litorea]|uniref:DoxX family protein n=1 Tax=Hirschia litorea TaxID=1199156 RepID=A0ABW2IH22_9PROT